MEEREQLSYCRSAEIPEGAFYTSGIPDEMFTCTECTTEPPTFNSFDELEIHIAGDHLNFYPYECEKCRFAKFPTEYALVTHSKSDHGMKDFYIRYRYTPENKQKQLDLRRKLNEFCEKKIAMSLKGETEEADVRRSSSMEKTEEDNDSNPSSVDLLPHPVPRTVHSPQTANLLAAMGKELPQPPQHQFPEHLALWAQDMKPHTSHVGLFNTTRNVDLSPMDFAPEAFAPGGLDFQAIINEADDLVKRPRDLVTCQICGVQISNQRSSLVYHANTKHIKLNLYQCTICNKTWQTIAKSDVLKHVKAVHNGDESMIIDNRKRLGFQLRVFVAKCFPPKNPQKNRYVQQNFPFQAACSAAADVASLTSFLTPKCEEDLSKHHDEGTYEELEEEDGL